MKKREAQPSPLTRRQFVAAAAGAGALLASAGLAGCTAPGNGEPDEPAAPVGLSAALASPMPTLPPEGAITPGTLSLLRHTAQGLYDWDPHTFKPADALAVGAPVQVSPTVYDVTLREGAAFSNGEPVTAEAVAASFDRLRNASSTYGVLLAPLRSVAALDERTVRVTLAYPMPLLVRERLALVPVTLPPADGAEGTAAAGTGSGPWLLSDVSADEGRLSFVPNGYYAGNEPPACSAMEWRFMAEGAARLQAAAAGEVQVATDLAPGDAEGISQEGLTTEYVPGFASPYVLFDCDEAPFNDVRVRQALLYAIDYDQAISEVLGSRATVPTGVLPTAHTGYVRAEASYSHDPERARQLLEKAGVEDLSFELDVQDEGLRPLASRLCADWTQVGVKATVSEQPGTLGAGLADFSVALCFDDPTLLGFDVDLLLTWRYGGEVSPERLGHWTGEAADKARSLMRQAREAADEATQRQLWEQCFAIIAEQVPLWPVAFLDAGTAWHAADLRGFEPLSTDGVDFLGVSLR